MGDSLAEGLRARISAAGTAVADTVDADKLVPLVVAEVDRYLEALEPDPSVRAAMREHPELAARWPLHAGQDWNDGGDGFHLRVLSGREWWPPDVTQADAANALQRVQDDAAARVASIMREHGVLWALNVTGGAAVGELRDHGRVHSEPGSWRSDGINYSGPAGSVPSAALGLNLSDAPESPGGSWRGDATEMARDSAWNRLERRWHPVAVAVLVHVERAVFRESPVLELEWLSGDWKEPQERRLALCNALLEGDDKRHVGELAAALRDELRELSNKLGGVDAIATPYLSHLRSIGQHGETLVAELRTEPTERHQKHGEQRGVVMLAATLWEDRVNPNRQQPLRPHGVTLSGDNYAKVPKLVAPLSWAFGGGADVEVNGDTYAREPGVATRVLIPRSAGLLPRGPHDKPHETWLPLDLRDELEPLPLTLATATANPGNLAMTPQAAKLALVALATPQALAGHFTQAQLGDVARLIHPGVSRLQAAQYKATARALAELDGLWICLPDDTKARMFSVRLPQSADRARPDQWVSIALAPSAVAAIGALGTVPRTRSYRGEFVLNLSGVLRLDNRKPGQLRQLTRASARWNAAGDPLTGILHEVKPISVDTWAAQVNAMSPEAVRYAAKNGTGRGANGRRAKAATVAHVRSDLEELAEKGLVKLGNARRGEVKIEPPDAWREARELLRKAGARPL